MLKVLIVDDEPDVEPLVRQRFRQQIREDEIEFTFAGNGVEALEKLAADQGIHVIFTDVNMPVMDGLTLLERLNQEERLLRTVIVSAYDDMQNIRTAMNRGAFDFLTKPIDFRDFETTLARTAADVTSLFELRRNQQELMALQSEISVASRIQQSILPRDFPEGAPVEIFAEMLPARMVSGDFYDFFPLDSDRMAIALGDVSGKGVPAALFMAITRTLLRALGPMHGHPSATLRALNELLLQQSQGEMYVTLFYAVYHTDSRELRYCVAGQTPPVILGANGEVRRLGERGNMLGLFDSCDVDYAEVVLQPGDRVLAYTDGVTDAENANGEPFNWKRLLTLLRIESGTTAREACEMTLAAVRRHCDGTTLADDLTMLAMRVF